MGSGVIFKLWLFNLETEIISNLHFILTVHLDIIPGVSLAPLPCVETFTDLVRMLHFMIVNNSLAPCWTAKITCD